MKELVRHDLESQLDETEKLQASPQDVKSAVEGIMYLLIECAKLNVGLKESGACRSRMQAHANALHVQFADTPLTFAIFFF